MEGAVGGRDTRAGVCNTGGAICNTGGGVWDTGAGVWDPGGGVWDPGGAVCDTGADVDIWPNGNEAEFDCKVPEAAILEFSTDESCFFFRKQKHMMEIEYRGEFENCGICRSGGPDYRWIGAHGVFGGGVFGGGGGVGGEPKFAISTDR